MRRLWYQDSYGRWHRDRQAERGAGSGGMPAKWAVIALMVLAGLIVLASLVGHGTPAPHP
jgi:hypothetical protein